MLVIRLQFTNASRILYSKQGKVLIINNFIWSTLFVSTHFWQATSVRKFRTLITISPLKSSALVIRLLAKSFLKCTDLLFNVSNKTKAAIKEYDFEDITLF